MFDNSLTKLLPPYIVANISADTPNDYRMTVWDSNTNNILVLNSVANTQSNLRAGGFG